MPSRHTLIKKLKGEARRQGVSFGKVREGGRHSIYEVGGVLVPIPRHAQINEYTAEDIYKAAEEALGKGWWR